ncbi:hypothetical protein M407DRAFT_25378 [Tulasnella calospora MUT 4182]|uniref:Uncharacterized protein n=1 Tax=Tulasnella calospora MUT 4182 TaxID=1051891 RepID=A0A0C3QHK2_9AGAM|nr:hypothetical protein M407DRAFT_25378 [Tulasnella calospora MUT 4182]
MFGHLFRSRRSTASPEAAFQTGLPSPERTAEKPPSSLTVKFQELKYALRPRRSSKKDGKQARQEQKPERHRYIPYSQRSGNVVLGPPTAPDHSHSLSNPPRQYPSSSAAAGLLQAGAPSTTDSIVPQSTFPVDASSTPPAPTTRTRATAPPRFPRAVPTSQPEEEYPWARKRIIEVRAMKAREEAQGINAVRTSRAQVVAPPTATTAQQSASEVAAQGSAKGEPTLTAKSHAKEMTEGRNRFDPDLYYSRRRFPENEMIFNDPRPQYKDPGGLRNIFQLDEMKPGPTQQGVLDPESNAPCWASFTDEFAQLVERASAVQIEREERRKRSPDSPRRYRQRNPQTSTAQAPLPAAWAPLKLPNHMTTSNGGAQPSLPTVDESEDADRSHDSAVHTSAPNPSLWMGQRIYRRLVRSLNRDSSRS